MKTSFKGFLLEATMTKIISLEDAVAFASKYCKQAFYAKPMYRGVKRYSSSAQLVHPSIDSSNVRRSTTGVNITNTLMSNLAEWKPYPKRNQSLIGSFDKGVARQYSEHVYRVFPIDNAKIAVCPIVDLWGSFDKAQEKIGVHVGDNEIFDKLIRDTADIILRKAGEEVDLSDSNINQFSYHQLVELFEKVDKALRKMKAEKKVRDLINELAAEYIGKSRTEFTSWVRYVLHVNSYLTAISTILDPIVNEFKIIQLDKLKGSSVDSQCEFWTSQPCVLINIDNVDDFDRAMTDHFENTIDH